MASPWNVEQEYQWTVFMMKMLLYHLKSRIPPSATHLAHFIQKVLESKLQNLAESLEGQTASSKDHNTYKKKSHL